MKLKFKLRLTKRFKHKIKTSRLSLKSQILVFASIMMISATFSISVCAYVLLQSQCPQNNIEAPSTLLTVKNKSFHTSEVLSMGRKLDEIFKGEKPTVVTKAQAKADGILLQTHLTEIRTKAMKTQLQIANSLGIKKSAVEGLEKSGRDMTLFELKRYIEAIGGKLSLQVELPDGSYYGFRV